MHSSRSTNSKPDYPRHLEPLRDQVLDLLDHDRPERLKLVRCRYKSRCHSVYCPLCRDQDAHTKKDKLVRGVSRLGGRLLKVGTFITRDVPLDALKETSKQIMQSVREVFRSTNTTDYAAGLETSLPDWSDLYHPHAHALLTARPGGRGFISEDGWMDAWLTALPDHLHPLEGASRIEPVREVDAVCSYVTKSPFRPQFNHVDIERTVEAIRAGKGLRQFSYLGEFTDKAAHCAKAA